MHTVRDAVDFVLRQERSVVFGNLGRYPHLLFEALREVPLIRVVVVDAREDPPVSSEERVRVQRPADPVERCDLLAYLEPASSQPVRKPPTAGRVAVFASHFAFALPSGERWTDVCYFHAPDPLGTAELLKRQAFPVQTSNVGLLELDRVNVVVVSGKHAAAPPASGAYVVVDLTRYDRDALSAFLAFWDAFDYLLEHRARVDEWVTCFSETNRRGFLRFCQRVVDAIFCRKFEHGNATDAAAVLSLLPFFRSGVVEKAFRPRTSSFGGLTFSAPKTVEEACQVAAAHDVRPLVKNVLILSDVREAR